MLLPGLELDWPLAYVVDTRGFSHACLSVCANESLCRGLKRRSTREWEVVVRPWAKVDCEKCRQKYRLIMRSAVELLVGNDIDHVPWQMIADEYELGGFPEFTRLCRRIAEILEQPATMQTPAERLAASPDAQRDHAFNVWVAGLTHQQIGQYMRDRGEMFDAAFLTHGPGSAIVQTSLRQMFDMLHPARNQ